MKVCIIQYPAGNVCSVTNALLRLGVEPTVTADADELRTADRIIFPGQGEAASTMQYLKAHGLDVLIKDLQQPFLGICIGQQLLCRHSEEGDTDCIGIFPVDVQRFRPARHADKVPAVGWNTLRQMKGGLFEQIGAEPYVYFVHSYYVPLCEWTVAETNYIVPYSAALQKNNFVATQFHPEKSGDVGERILENFLNLH